MMKKIYIAIVLSISLVIACESADDLSKPGNMPITGNDQKPTSSSSSSSSTTGGKQESDFTVNLTANYNDEVNPTAGGLYEVEVSILNSSSEPPVPETINSVELKLLNDADGVVIFSGEFNYNSDLSISDPTSTSIGDWANHKPYFTTDSNLQHLSKIKLSKQSWANANNFAFHMFNDDDTVNTNTNKAIKLNIELTLNILDTLPTKGTTSLPIRKRYSYDNTTTPDVGTMPHEFPTTWLPGSISYMSTLETFKTGNCFGKVMHLYDGRLSPKTIVAFKSSHLDSEWTTLPAPVEAANVATSIANFVSRNEQTVMSTTPLAAGTHCVDMHATYLYLNGFIEDNYHKLRFVEGNIEWHMQLGVDKAF